LVRIGAYPGTFDPPTVAHLAIAEAALRQGGLHRICLVVSRSPLGKDPAVPTFEHRLSVLSEVAASRPWLDVAVSEHTLIADLANGYDAVVMGTDKWQQVCDPVWYGGSVRDRDAALDSLPRILLANRSGQREILTLPDGALVLAVDEAHQDVSSSAVRAGRLDWMAPEAAEFDIVTGAWSRPDRYPADGGIAASPKLSAPERGAPPDYPLSDAQSPG
jgi:hypothetical protein